MNNREIIIGTRGSRLALMQTQIVIKSLKKKLPHLNIKTKIIKTSGDRGKLNSLGAFVGEIEKALLKKEIDLAIHSFKDMPSVLTPGLKFSAILKREDAREVLIFKKGESFDPQKNYVIGTGSPRRQLLLNHYYPHFKVVSIRGNVDTRISKIDFGQLNGVMLAAAGLIRIGMADRISEYLPINKFIPAPGQGALAVQTREDDTEMIELVTPLEDTKTRFCSLAERILLEEILAGCSIPLGAYAECFNENEIKLIAFYGYNKDGQINFEETSFAIDNFEKSAKETARRLKQNFVA